MKFPEGFFEDEVRDGFYVSSLMKRAWAAQLELLNIIMDICKKQGIQCFAEWGTLLGAVRHGGMIPWDDDIDICMKREDYIKFLSVADKELPDGCWVMDYRTSDEIDNLVGRVLNSRMYVVEEEQLERYHGFPYMVGIDIFPLDYLPASPSEKERFTNLLRKVVLLIQKIYKKKNNLEEITQKEIDARKLEIEMIFGISFDEDKPLNQQLYALIDNRMSSMVKESEANEVTNFSTYVQNPNYRMAKSFFQETVSLPFENMEILVPARYDDLLKLKYGDYRKIIRSGSTHDYPFYEKIRKYLSDDFGLDVYRYEVSENEWKSEKKVTEETLKSRINQFLPLFKEAHNNIKALISQGNSEIVLEILEECQNVAIQIGTMVEEEQGENQNVVKILEQYCELVFRIHENLLGNSENLSGWIEDAYEELNNFEEEFKESIEELKARKKIVFVPYKAACWNTMENFWREAMDSKDTDVYVVPAPYYYKDVYGNVKKEEIHYEKEGYPENVTITSYEDFNFEVQHPDVIVIQCPYDEYNYALTIHPFFYAKNLKKYTEELVYIPAFVMDEMGPEDERAKEMLKAYCNTPGVVMADKVILQSEQMKNVYVELLTEFAGENTKEIWQQKIHGKEKVL